MRRLAQGFTLLELLVAISIFSFMSIMAYGTLTNVLKGNEVIAEQEQRLKILQRTMMFLERDIRQVVARPRASGFNQRSPAFVYGLDADGLLEFTRAGNDNPLGLKRSSLQRIRYDLEDKKLTRNSWSIVDHIDAEPVSMSLIEDVESLELRLLDSNNEWQENWNQNTVVPKAVEITMKHKHWGEIIRIIPIQ